MEKERKSLFGKLLDFWKEKFAAVEEDGIGFQYEKENVADHFAEMGAVAVLSRNDVKKDFLTEAAEEEKKKESLIFAGQEKEMQKPKEMEVFSELKKILLQESNEAENQQKNTAFLQEEPLEAKEKRQVISITPEKVKETDVETAEENRTEVVFSQAEKQKDAEMDVEKLMQQITKKLWEEREGCGRRLR